MYTYSKTINTLTNYCTRNTRNFCRAVQDFQTVKNKPIIVFKIFQHGQ